MNEIKYWLYYLKENNEIYAYTDNKEYAKLFENDRDMTLFNKIKKEISKNEINYLAREYQNCYLKDVSLKIFDKSKQKWFDGNIIMTGEEYLSVTSAEIQLMEVELYQHCWDNPIKFKDKIIKALEILEYNNVYRSIVSTDENIKINIKVDPLGIFLHYYGKSMKG